jgi:DNA-binding NtrC family response regulator
MSLMSNRILVVEDDDDHRVATCSLLRARRRDVVGADSAEKALGILDTQEVGVMLIDINLPGMSGIELAEQVAGLSPPIKIVLTSGGVGTINHELNIKFTYLAKPYDVDTLMSALDGDPA